MRIDPISRRMHVGTGQQLNIGLIGAGVVGGGVVKNLTRNADLIAERLGLRLNLKWVCDKDPGKLKALPVPASAKTGDARQVLADSGVPVIVELVGGTGFAKTLILDALGRGKTVVTANKALLAHNGEEIIAAAATNKWLLSPAFLMASYSACE